jgi:hypothetical protein
MNMGRLSQMLSLVAVVAVPTGDAAATDLHDIWDSRCAGCHRHAGEFARNHFEVKDGRLVGRKPTRDICGFLASHGGAAAEAKAICAMLTAQAQTPSLFKAKCAGCHESAAALARTGLVTAADGVLKGRQNGQEVAAFLATHGGLAAAEIPTMVGTLTRVLGEVDAVPAE